MLVIDCYRYSAWSQDAYQDLRYISSPNPWTSSSISSCQCGVMYVEQLKRQVTEYLNGLNLLQVSNGGTATS
jgi:hypothetical protein